MSIARQHKKIAKVCRSMCTGTELAAILLRVFHKSLDIAVTGPARR